ncbi:hypothetical protein SETIT_2G408900v2 [Setaria italica]|uniref:Uncharacterized protein n=1 Tax=Setaria italica TaxID=4555 RepID=A0A368Q939_SETIT|nr:hypothetical protein SETIT_2G408900v2 [Setaria italica]
MRQVNGRSRTHDFMSSQGTNLSLMQQSSRPQKRSKHPLSENSIFLPGESTCKRSKHLKKGNTKKR